MFKGRGGAVPGQSRKNTANLQTGFVGRFEEKSRKIWQKFTHFLSRKRRLIFCSVLHMHPLPSQFLVLTSYLFSTIHMVPTLNVILLLQYNNSFLLSPTFLVTIFWHHLRLPTLNRSFFSMKVTLASFSSYFNCNHVFSTIHMIPPPHPYYFPPPTALFTS